jgi:hypothetical protein
VAACTEPNPAYRPEPTGRVDDDARAAGATTGGTPPALDAGPSLPRDAGVPEASAPPRPDGSAIVGASAFCPADKDLVGCFRFENAVVDESAARLGVKATAPLYAVGRDGLALDMSGSAIVAIAETPALDFKHFTIEVWVYARSLPTDPNRMGIVDNEGQYGLFLYPGGDVRCSAEVEQWARGAVRASQWTAIACVLDEQGMNTYVNGMLKGTTKSTLAPATSGGSGLTIGTNNQGASSASPDRFDGLIDDLRLWSRARTAAELCPSTGGCRP